MKCMLAMVFMLVASVALAGGFGGDKVCSEGSTTRAECELAREIQLEHCGAGGPTGFGYASDAMMARLCRAYYLNCHCNVGAKAEKKATPKARWYKVWDENGDGGFGRQDWFCTTGETLDDIRKGPWKNLKAKNGQLTATRNGEVVAEWRNSAKSCKQAAADMPVE